MSLSPSFLDLPIELRCRILVQMDLQSLLNMSLTCKSMNEIICTSNELLLNIEMTKSQLVRGIRIGSNAIARRHIQAHNIARLELPITTSTGVKFDAPDVGIMMERLFRGLFACITDDSELHLWDIRWPIPNRPPRKILTISEPNLMDVVIEPVYNLLVLLCYQTGDDHATIKLLDLSSKGTRSHPLARSHVITHRLLPGDSVERDYGQQLLTLRGNLLAFVYEKDSQQLRRGVIWVWRAGLPIYDSLVDHPSSEFHDILLLASGTAFLVTVSTFLIREPSAPFGGSIELRCLDVMPGTCRLVAEFRLPEFENPTEFCLGALDFCSSEPANWIPIQNDLVFPFVSNPNTSVHVLYIWYKPRQDNDINHGGSRVHLVISDRIFNNVLQEWMRRNDSDHDTSFPLRHEWDAWAPWWTSMWNFKDLGNLSVTSSVCGSRVCAVRSEDDGSIVRLVVVDFNMNFPCNKRNCTDDAVHFYPKTFRSGDDGRPLWARAVHTWLPFHTHFKRFTFPGEDFDVMICGSVLMDEERMIFSILDASTHEMDAMFWEVVHLLHASVGGNYFVPLPNDEVMRPIRQHDEICRLCKAQPHTDAHILLECTEHPRVVELRQTHLIDGLARNNPKLYSMWCRQSFVELFKEIMARRDAIHMSISLLVIDIKEIYQGLPRCSEFVVADGENSASILFVTEQ